MRASFIPSNGVKWWASCDGIGLPWLSFHSVHNAIKIYFLINAFFWGKRFFAWAISFIRMNSRAPQLNSSECDVTGGKWFRAHARIILVSINYNNIKYIKYIKMMIMRCFIDSNDKYPADGQCLLFYLCENWLEHMMRFNESIKS